MKKIKLILFLTMLFLSAPAVQGQDTGVSLVKRHYDFAQEVFQTASSAEETARLATFASDVASYYEIALKHYQLALDEAQYSMGQAEELSKKEIKNRQRIISESLRKVAICQNKYDDATYRQFYDNAARDFDIAQKAEESAKFCTYAANIADYYEIAIKNYKRALKQAVRSTESSEELSEREKHSRERIISESRERIEASEKKLSIAIVGTTFEDLRQKAHHYVVAGFNYATAGDKKNARRTWHEAIRLYEEAVRYTEDQGAKEVIRSKLQAIGNYLKYVE